jgi:putative transposase
LDAFAAARTGPAWKQVGLYRGSPDPHGDRQWRCESETAGRILRAQATRKRAFTLVQPILTHGFILPKTARKPAGKHRRAIKDALSALKQVQEEEQSGQEGDETIFVALQNVVEQACNFFLECDRFPITYEEMQPIPLLEVGLLTYAGDDGPDKGQAYRLRLDVNDLDDQGAGMVYFRFRFPDAEGRWGWRAGETRIPLPQLVQARLRQGELLAPTLREVRRATGKRYAVLDLPIAVPVSEPVAWESVERVVGADWGVHTLLTATAIDTHEQQVGRPFFLNTGGFDGRQARTRRQIDELKAKKARFEQARDALPKERDHLQRPWYTQRIAAYEREIARCWRKYDLRNRTLAHLAANVLLLLCHLHGSSLLAMESLKTLKTTGRGRGVRGRWRNYRNNTTIRGEIWRLLRYKCWLAGIRFYTARPRDTSHTCPHCGAPAQTYRSPRARQRGEAAIEWGRWLWCAACNYNGDRDYCASLNIARLGVAALVHRQQTGAGRAFAVRDPQVKPVSYTVMGSVLLLPPTGRVPARLAPPTGSRRGTICYLPGWYGSAFLQSSLPQAVFLRLCG